MDITGIDLLGIDRVLKRGTGTVLEENKDALLVRDGVSGAYMLAFTDAAAGLSALDGYAYRADCDLLMVPDLSLGRAAMKRYGFTGMLECWQVAYYGDMPGTDGGISVRTADKNDIGFLIGNYDMLSADEIAKVVERGSVLIAYADGAVVGFIGEHLEGSMGMLYILPEFRRRGYASALENILIAETMKKGFIPFGQVEKNNTPSLILQKKLGLTVSDRLICWMWK